MTIFTVDLDDYIQAKIGGAIFLFVLVVFLIISITTNYVEVGFAAARTLLGAVLMITILVNSIKGIAKGKVRKKIIGIIEILLVIALGIYGFNNQLYSSRMTILYSNFMSIFAKPIFGYIIIWLLNALPKKEEADFELIGMFLAYIGLIAICFTMLVIFNFTNNTKALAWVSKNFKHYNLTMISSRIEKYGADDIETVLPQALENSKNELLENGYSLEEVRDHILEGASENHFYLEYILDDYYELSDNIYVCNFYDQYQYDDSYEYPRYYVKIDFSSFTVLEYMEWFYEVSDEALEYVKNGLTDSKGALIYGVERCVNEGEELTSGNINNHIKEVEDATYFCYSVEDSETDETKYRVVMYYAPGDKHPTMSYSVNKTTYKVSY